MFIIFNGSLHKDKQLYYVQGSRVFIEIFCVSLLLPQHSLHQDFRYIDRTSPMYFTTNLPIPLGSTWVLEGRGKQV